VLILEYVTIPITLFALLSGKVFMPENTGLRAADRQQGYIHSCVAFPLEDLQIRLPG